MFSLLISFAELVLPSIFVMADKPDQIPPDFSLCHIQYFNQTCIPREFRIFHLQDTHLSFFSQHNNQFVDSMYNESSPLSNINSSLIIQASKYAVNNPIIHTFYSHIFSKEIYLLQSVTTM